MSPTAKVKPPPKQSTRTSARVTRSSSTRSAASRIIVNAHMTATSTTTTRISSSRVTVRQSARQRSNASTSNTPVTPQPQVEENPVDQSVMQIDPPTPQNEQNSVQIVDLSTPQPLSVPVPTRPTRRPVEVDLTCDLDDEVFVVLEDIVNPSRRTNPSDLPVMLGTSPPRVRVNRGPRNLRSTFGSSSENPRVLSDVELYIQSPTQVVPHPPESPKQDAHGIHCPICFETLSQLKKANKQIKSTSCGHLFCGPCITRAIATVQQCPTCRQKQDSKTIHPIFI